MNHRLDNKHYCRTPQGAIEFISFFTLLILFLLPAYVALGILPIETHAGSILIISEHSKIMLSLLLM